MSESPIKVLSFNIWGGGLHQGRALDETVAVLRASGADIIGLQEVHSMGGDCASQACADGNPSIACRIARELGFHCHEQAAPVLHGLNAVLSRYPVTGETSSRLGVTLDVDGRAVTVFNLHLANAPYQPYQLTGIAYAEAPFLTTADEAVAAATAARGHVLQVLEQDLAELGNSAAIITGDFNEPSHRDWTARAAALGLQPLAVAWPTTARLEALGFVDVYRAIFPDEVLHPGFTWTVRPAAREHHDRIDFIFVRGTDISVDAAAIVGEDTTHADLVVTPWPSDHRAMFATLRFSPVRMSSAEQATDR